MADSFSVARRPTVPLVALLALACSCNPSTVIPPTVPDDCFGGTFWDGEAFFRVTHVDGILSAVGSPTSGSDWEALSYSGYVAERGVVTGEARIWRLAGDERESLTFTLALRLSDGANCTERDSLSYGFHFVSFRDGSYINGNFEGSRGID